MNRSITCLLSALATSWLTSSCLAQTFSNPFRKTAASYSETQAQQQRDEWEPP